MGDFLRNGYILALLMFMVTMVQNSLLQTHYHLVIREGIRLRAALQVNVCRLSLLPDLRARNGRSAIWWRYLNSVIRSEDKRKMFPSFLFYTIQVGIWQLTHLVVGDQVLVNLKVWIHHWWRSPCYSSLSFALLSLLFSAVNLTLHFNCSAPSHRRGSTANHCASRPIWLATATWRCVTWPITWRPTASTWWCLRFYSTSSGHFRCR